jgi:predicted ATP-grasp superfamily ATP-dependent carboligase
MIALEGQLPVQPAMRDVASTPQSRAAPPAIVIGLEDITGLQTARILARRGVRVIGIPRYPRSPHSLTRACDRVVIADHGGMALIDVLEALGEAGDGGVLIPCSDRAVLQISLHRDRLEPVHTVSLPDHRTIETLLDKAAFAEHAKREGLPIPRTVVIGEGGEAIAAASGLEFPCILKPAVKTGAWVGQPKAFKVHSARELVDLYSSVSPFADRFVVQEWIEGEASDLYSCLAYFDQDARPLVTFVDRKVRQWPLEAGTVSLAVECRNDEVLHETLRLYEGVGHHGFGFLEMKRHARTGEHLIVEPNVGRPVSSVGLPEAGGVELHYTAYCAAAGLELPRDREQRYVGAKWVSLRNDLKSGLAHRRQGKLSWREWLRSLRAQRPTPSSRPPTPYRSCSISFRPPRSF